MKDIISILGLVALTSSLYASVGSLNAQVTPTLGESKELAWVDEQIQAIIPARKGIENAYINSVIQPFIFTKPKDSNLVKTEAKGTSTKVSRGYKKPSGRSLTLNLIINSKAMINGKWYSKNDKVKGYKIASIDNATVTLVKNKKTKTLSMKKDNKNIKIHTK